MEIYNLSNKELKIIILKEISEMQNNTDRQFNRIRKQCMSKMRILLKKQKP